MDRRDGIEPDWDPRAVCVRADQRAAYDHLRAHCPVAYSDLLGWSLFRHDDVVRALLDHESFSSVVSRHRSVPNGMDPPEHAVYRGLIDPYFSPERVDALEPICRGIVADLLDDVLARGEIELMAEFALPEAVRVQCAFLGWSDALREPLIAWTRKNREATLAQDRPALAALAQAFQELVVEMLDQRRQRGAAPDGDVTAALMRETVDGRPLSDSEITSILRNWTVGEIGTIAASIGILVHGLAERPELQARLRSDPSLAPPAIEEMLRLHGPLVANRRVTTRAVTIGGRTIAAGERVSVNWVSANRDERVFDAAAAFNLDRDPAGNLLFGAGIHACPGAPLVRMQLRVTLEEFLRRTRNVELVPDHAPTLEAYPGSGFARLPLRLA